MLNLGDTIYRRLDEIAQISEPGPGVTRLPFTRQHRQALNLLKDWMARAGLEIRLDAAGTLIGRREGPPDAKTLFLGSHQDSVRQGGKYDGILGVVLPLVCLEALKDEPLNVSVELLAFADEEGVRFPTALMGPRALAGTFDPKVLALTDRDGISLGDAMRDFGLDPDAVSSLKRNPSDLAGYVEVHIEQGPVLQDEEHPVGIVTAICGIERWAVRLTGKAAHAGTTPMNLRQDALTGASEIILEVEKLCRETDGLVGTVGELEVKPNAVNAVPGETRFPVEMRAGDDATRLRSGEDLQAIAARIAGERNLELEIEKTYQQPAVQCDQALSDALVRAAIYDNSAPPPRLGSGATHDASAMADVTPITMLFVQNRDGLSHHPDESVKAGDVDVAAKTLFTFIKSM